MGKAGLRGRHIDEMTHGLFQCKAMVCTLSIWQREVTTNI